MRIFAAGIATETNTFAPLPTSLDDFIVVRGSDADDGRPEHASLDLSRLWGSQAKAGGLEFVFGLNAWAQPSGITQRSAYESLRDEMLATVRTAMPVDIVLLMLHGAMIAEGYDDCEKDMIDRVRDIVGPRAVIAVELDLHCHLSEEKIKHADLIITYKEYPHVDINERATELFDLAVAARLGKVRPTMALFDCLMVGMYPTSRPPLRALVDEMKEAERRPGVLSVSFGHGFQFADLPHVGAKVLVVTDSNPALAAQVAREFGLRVRQLRRQIGFDSFSLPMDAALSQALASGRAPIVVADQSDNTGAGAPGDATFVLRWLLDHGAQDCATAIFYDPEVVRIARKAGPGAQLPVRLGGKVGSFSGDPVDMVVTVLAIRTDYVHTLRQRTGPPTLFPAGDVVALRSGTIDVVVSSRRCQCCDPSVFTDLGIDPTHKRLLIPKSTQHFHDSFAAIAADVLYMTGPGAVPPDPRQITYRRLDTSRLYPWNDTLT